MEDPGSVLDLVRAVTARPGYTSAVGMTVLVAEPGEVHLELKRRPDLLQFNGFFHGGVISGLADHAAGRSKEADAALADGGTWRGAPSSPTFEIAVTIDLHVNFLAPADGESIVARARALQIGGTVCTARVEVFTRSQVAERLCAFSTVTLRVVDRPDRKDRPPHDPARRTDG